MPLRVLFICIGNSCRSQMAEGFARAYGSDVILASSAGLAPAGGIAPLTRQTMLAKNIDLANAFPKTPDTILAEGVDLIVNMSGRKLPFKPKDVEIEDWQVRDPIGLSDETFREVADDIEHRVMRLILRVRAEAGSPGLRRPPAAETRPREAPPAKKQATRRARFNRFDSGRTTPGE